MSPMCSGFLLLLSGAVLGFVLAAGWLWFAWLRANGFFRSPAAPMAKLDCGTCPANGSDSCWGCPEFRKEGGA